MRDLKTNDIFKMSKILKKMQLNIDVNGKSQDQVGAEFIKSIFESLHLAQNEINEFLGDIFGMTGEEFGNLPLEESLEYVKQFKSIPNLSNFFKLAGQLMK
ncbi:MAG: hypothetical protein ACOZCL_08455 [Bacillota bacterium]